jgi:hypothetical protein
MPPDRQTAGGPLRMGVRLLRAFSQPLTEVTKDRLIAGVAAACFVVFLLLQLHGFSLAIWGNVLPEGASVRPLVGHARPIRFDDWMAQLPAIISQTYADPAYPATNHLIHPDGHEMRLGMTAPVLAWEAVFKPTIWGYFVSPDFGLSWHWQFRVFLLFGAAYAFFRSVMGATATRALWGTACLLFSSFFAYWSFISEPITGFGLLAAVLIHRQVSQPDAGIWELVLLFWVIVAFALNMLYPPFQVPVVSFVAATALWSGSEYHRSSGRWPLPAVARVLGVVGLAAAVIGLHFSENLAALHKILDTQYPGRRFCMGGDLSFGRMLTMSFLPLRRFQGFPELNACEAGASFFVGLLAVPLLACCWRRLSPRGQSLGVLLGVLTAITAIYAFVGVPHLAAKLSGWSRVPGPRTLGIWTLLNACWLVWWVQFRPDRLTRTTTAAWCLGMLGIVALAAAGAWGDYPWLSTKVVILGGLLIASVAILLQFLPGWGQAATLVILAAGSISFNPIDRCTHSKILELPIVDDLRAEFTASGKEAVLLLDGDLRTANFLRLIGIPGFGGMHLVPQLSFWQTLDPEGTSDRLYNRFAHVLFSRGPADSPTTFESPQPDILRVSLSPDDIERLSARALVKDHLWETPEDSSSSASHGSTP